MKDILIVLSLLLITSHCQAQNVKYIQLKQEKVSYHPKGFYVDGVTDDRQDAGAVGTISSNGKREQLSFPNGAAAALNSFIANNVLQNKATQPASLHISKMDFAIKKQGTLWYIDASVILTFYVADKKIVEYISKGQGQMDSDPALYSESFIRQAIGNDLKKFDDWWAQNKGRVPVMSEVKVNVTMAATTTKPNSIVYSLGRPLQIADFTGPPQGQEFELAVTVSGIGLGYSATAENSQVVLDVTITPYFNKAQSWFKPAGKNPRVLAHEQTHFDITAIKACELVAAIKHTTFTQDNYVQLLEELQKKNADESNEEEQRYDRETNHGIITEMQQAWEKKISEQVKAIGCYL